MIKEIEFLESSNREGGSIYLENKKKDLENLRKQKMQGKILRSKIQWIEEGEKPTKYFCGLESKNFTNKIIPKVQLDDGHLVTEQHDILREAKKYYESLYEKKDCGVGCSVSNLERDLKDLEFNKLTLNEQLNLEGEITVKEAGEALRKMSNNKSPGSDGFTSEFLKFFWKDLKYFIVESLNYGYSVGEMSVTTNLYPRQFLGFLNPISFNMCSF